jgi:hypothetical protein
MKILRRKKQNQSEGIPNFIKGFVDTCKQKDNQYSNLLPKGDCYTTRDSVEEYLNKINSAGNNNKRGSFPPEIEIIKPDKKKVDNLPNWKSKQREPI